MANGEATDAADADAEESKAGSLDPFPQVDRDVDRTTDDQTTDDENGTARQSEAGAGSDDERTHVCDPDSPVPCQFH